MERQSLPHQRNHCQTHPFNSQNLNRRNHFICKKCYCFVCDKPASECKEWFDPDRPDDLSAHHCNAYLSKTVIHWQTKRWLASNPVQHFGQFDPTDSSGQAQKASVMTLYESFQRTKSRMDRSWRLYEAGETKEVGDGHQQRHPNAQVSTRDVMVSKLFSPLEWERMKTNGFRNLS